MPAPSRIPGSVFDLFKIGIGPSSSHTMGPMVAARYFVRQLAPLSQVARLRVTLYGSLAATGRGHATDKAVFWGLGGLEPESVTPAAQQQVLDALTQGELMLDGQHRIPFDTENDLVWAPETVLPEHPNALKLEAVDARGNVIKAQTAFSIGGGAVHYKGASHSTEAGADTVPYPYQTGVELVRLCKQHDLRVSDLVRANELASRTPDALSEGIRRRWEVMQACVRRGLTREGTLPGGLRLRRRAPGLYRSLSGGESGNLIASTLPAMDWLNLYALAVNEENAAGGQVVTAPTNGAAGIIPAVLHYYVHFARPLSDEALERFFLAATAIGDLIRRHASISGAEVGCQGEVGSACAMAAAGLAEVLGGTPRQVENAAEIGLEHNLGLTCDPVKGLVQVPCIERNAIAAVKAVNAAQMALRGDGYHFVSLDRVIRTLRDTGADMADKYKETARGGLAVNYPEC